MKKYELLEQSEPYIPWSQVHCPVLKSHGPFPLQVMSPIEPGHGLSRKKYIDINDLQTVKCIYVNESILALP